MSTNIHFEAQRSITVDATGAKEIQKISFRDVWQTPTVVTRELMSSSDPFAAYRDWVLSISRDVLQPVYGDDDIFCEGPVIGQETVNAGRDHIAEFDKWIGVTRAAGYEIQAVAR